MSSGQPRSRDAASGDNTSEQTERRSVRSAEPSLSDRANELLTHELRAAIGRDEVVVPKDVPHRSRQPHAMRSRFVATLGANRPILIVTLLAALVVGGVVALATGQYWAVVVAAALHAMGTLAVAVGAIGLTTNVEHVDPAVAARLEEEGVADPDRVLSELIEDFAGVRDARGVPEVITPGHNERTATPEHDQSRAAVEQRTSLTPTSGRAPAGGSSSPVEALEWWIAGAISVLSVVVAAIIGGEMWALPASFLPLGAGWIALQYWMAGRRDRSARPTGETTLSRRKLVPLALLIVAGVIWFMVVVGWLAGLW